MEDLELGEYYLINNSNRVLYWDGEKWLKPRKDAQKRFGSLVEPLDKQPKVKTVVNVKETEYVGIYKMW